MIFITNIVLYITTWTNKLTDLVVEVSAIGSEGVFTAKDSEGKLFSDEELTCTGLARQLAVGCV